MCREPRAEFFAAMDATNVDLKFFSEPFYRQLSGGELAPVLDTLEYIAQHHTNNYDSLDPGHERMSVAAMRMTRRGMPRFAMFVR